MPTGMRPGTAIVGARLKALMQDQAQDLDKKLFRIRRDSPFFMPPRLPGKRQGRFHDTPVSVTQELYPFL